MDWFKFFRSKKPKKKPGQLLGINKADVPIINFNKVGGLEEAKEELSEALDFLKNAKKGKGSNATHIPNILLVGSKGCGKTLLAKAIAGEAKVSLYSISKSNFTEENIGFGARHLYNFFRKGKQYAPCVLLIDDIEVIGSAKSQKEVNDRRNTFNQLLVELDGLQSEKGFVLIATTHRPDLLNSSLLHPKYFNRQIGIDRPDLKGREAIFKIHLKNIETSLDIQPSTLAEMTPGFSGADIENVCNEASLTAARRNKEEVDMDDFNHALDRMIGGLEKKNKIITPQEKNEIAYNIAGYVITNWHLTYGQPLVKATIIPRGVGTLGYVQYYPEKQISKQQELDRICAMLGGRAADKIIYNRISSGSQSSLEQATKLADSYIERHGRFINSVDITGKDIEARILLDFQYERAQIILQNNRDQLDKVAHELEQRGVLLKSEIEKLIGRKPQ